MALSGHAARSAACLLLGVKRTSLTRTQMSAIDPGCVKTQKSANQLEQDTQTIQNAPLPCSIFV